jgi:hypothetical protein
MRKYLKSTLITILIFIFIILLSIGIYYVSYNLAISSKINKIEEENNQFYELLNDKNIDFDNYVLYEEVFMDNQFFYLVFTEDNTAIYEDGEILQGILIKIDCDVITEYKSDFNLELEGSNYLLPSLWIAGGNDSAYSTVNAFWKRAELRRLIIENSSNIVLQNISIKIEGSHCLGKILFE